MRISEAFHPEYVGIELTHDEVAKLDIADPDTVNEFAVMIHKWVTWKADAKKLKQLLEAAQQ